MRPAAARTAAVALAIACASCGRTGQVKAPEPVIAAPLPPKRPVALDVAKAPPRPAKEPAEAAPADGEPHPMKWLGGEETTYAVPESDVIGITVSCRNGSMSFAYTLREGRVHDESKPARIKAGKASEEAARTLDADDSYGGYPAIATVGADGPVARAVYAGSAISIDDGADRSTAPAMPATIRRALEKRCVPGR